MVGRKLYVTDFGRQLVVAAERILDEVDAIAYHTESFLGRVTGRLRLAIVSTAEYVMPYFLSDFMDLHPRVDLTMDVTNKQRVVTALEQNEVDFALVSVTPSHLDLNTVPLMSNKLYLVRSTKRAAPRPSSLEDLLDRPLIFREAGSATRAAMEGYLSDKNLPGFRRIELTSNEAVKQAVIAGLGYSIMPLIGLKNALQHGEVEIITLPDLPIVTEWNIVWLKSKQLPPVAEAYLAYINEERERIVLQDFNWINDY